MRRCRVQKGSEKCATECVRVRGVGVWWTVNVCVWARVLSFVCMFGLVCACVKLVNAYQPRVFGEKKTRVLKKTRGRPKKKHGY